MRTRARRILAWPVSSFLACCSLLCCGIGLTQARQGNPNKHEFHWDSHAWQELGWSDWLERAKFRKADREQIAAVITQQLKANREDFDFDTEERLREAVLRTRVKMIDLNGDGVSEVVAQGFAGCSATGNCPFWIFQKTAKYYEPLLETVGQTFTIQKQSTRGYRDVVVSVHGSATQSGLTDFRYSDGKYVAVGCYNAEWEILENDEVKELKEPRITRSSCGQ